MFWALTTDKTSTTGDVERTAFLNQPGPRADLKRCVGKALDHQYCLKAWRHLEPFLPDDATVAEERALLAVSAMMCAQPPAARVLDRQSNEDFGDTSSLGASMAISVHRHVQSDRAGEHRLILLSRQSLDGIHRLLPRTVLHLRGKQIPVDWRQLIEDLASWPADHRRTASRWLRHYHRTLNRLKVNEATDQKTLESETP